MNLKKRKVVFILGVKGILIGVHMLLKYQNINGDPHLSDHAIPLPINVLSMPPVGHQVKVVGETHNFCQSLEDVDAEPFAAVLHGPVGIHHQTEETM